jgi:LETM1 and EF-hand domain-containing protein 1
MAKFLQETLDNMSVSGKGHTCDSAKEFAEFFAKVFKTICIIFVSFILILILS